MYLAKMSDSLSGAKYYYKNNSIYFNVDYSISEADVFALHECLHYLQEVRDEKGNLIRLGLYDFSNNHGMALNEAAVQLMTVCSLNNPIQEVSYYNMNIPTNSIDCYPLECTIVRQMAYFSGTYPLFYSTLKGNDVFKNTFSAIASEKAFNKIEANLDKMLELETELQYYFNELKEVQDNIKKVRRLNAVIDNTKKEIMNLFFSSQNVIISNCFSKALDNARTLEDVKELKDKAYKFQDYIATNSNYTFYNEFYRNLMEKLDKKATYIEEHGPFEIESNLSTGITIISKSKGAFDLLRRIFNRLGLSKERG